MTLTTSTGYPVTNEAVTYDHYYSLNRTDSPTAQCPVGTVPLTAGWRSPGTFVAGIDVHTVGRYNYVDLDARDSATATKTRAVVRCARGSRISAKLKRSRSATVSCGRKLALGIALTSNGPFQATAGASVPAGVNRWRNTMEEADAEALCVPRAAFSSVKIVKRATSFRVGRSAATVTTACPRRHMAISWGVELPVMPGNVWKPSGITNTRATPYVASSSPRGRGWSVTFRTADAAPASTAARVATRVICAVPAR